MKKMYLAVVFTLFTLFLAAGIQEAGSLLDVGIEEYNKGQYSFAINNLRKYIQIADDTHNKAKAYYYISLCYYFEGEYPVALKYLNELSAKFRLSEYSSQTHFWKGLIYQNLEDWENAENSFLTYVSFIKTSDLTPRAYLAAANCQIEMKKYGNARTTLERIIKDFSKSEKFEEASVLYFYVLIMTKGYSDRTAQDFISSWMERLGDTGKDYIYKDRFWLYAAEIVMAEGNFGYARSLLKKIDSFARDSESSAIALLRLYEIEQKLGNPDEARLYLIRLGNEYPASKYALDASLAMGILEYRKENYTDALVFFKQTLDSTAARERELIDDAEEKARLETIRLKTKFYQAEAYYQTGKTGQAIALLFEVKERKSQLEKEAVLRLLEIYLEQNNTSEAARLIKAYEKVLSVRENVQDTDKKSVKDTFLLYKAKYYYLTGDYSLASKTLDSIENSQAFGYSVPNLKAKVLIKEQKVGEALEILDRSVHTAPLDQKPYIAYEIMALLFSQKKYSEALEYRDFILTYSKHLPDDKKLVLVIKTGYLGGICCLQTKKYTDGIKLFKEIQLSASQAEKIEELGVLIKNSYYYLGWIYYKISDYNEAAKHFGTASLVIKEVQLAADAAYMEAWSYFSYKNFKSAAAKFEALYERRRPDPLAYTAFYRMAKCYENMQDTQRSLALYKQLYYELPENAYKDQALFEIIKDSIEKGSLEAANTLIGEFKQKYPASPLYKRTLIMEAEAFLTAERYSEALSSYKYIMQKFPDYENLDTVLYWAGFCGMLTRDYETAREVLTRLKLEFPGSSFYLNGLYLLADLYKVTQSYSEEHQLLTELLATDIPREKQEQYRSRIKIVKAVLNGYREEEAQLLVAAQTGNLEAKYKLGLYYSRQNRTDEAYTVMNELAAEKENIYGSYGANYIADISFRAGDYSQAVTLFSQVIKAYKTNDETASEALYKIAFCYNKQGRGEAALTIISTLKQKYPASPWTGKAIELEQRMQNE